MPTAMRERKTSAKEARQKAKAEWRKRLDELPGELETEPARIRASYEVKATRFEPAGLVYLWPITG